MNLNQITKIRLSLEALTTLMQPKSNESEKSTDHPTWANVKLKDTNDDVTVEEKSNNNSQS